MTYSEIIITFNNEIEDEGYVNFRAYNNTASLAKQCTEQFLDTGRTAPGQVSILNPTATAGERSAISYLSAFNIDYNATSLYDVSRVDNVVTIKCKTPDYTFDFTDIPALNSPNVSFVINNYAGSLFTIDSVSFSEATTNPVCTHYKVTVTTSEIATEIIKPTAFAESGNTDNPIVFELMRGNTFELDLEAADGQTAYQFFNLSSVPGILSSANFTIQITNSPNGATIVAVSNQTIPVVALEYSLNNIDWQSSNTFPGLLSDDYTMYIRDDFGCSVQIDFSVDDDNVVEPFFYISKSMSIKYAGRVTYGDCGPYKTEEDTLSCEEFAKNPKLAYKEIQQFQTCDSPVTQFMSNYSNITAKVIQEDGTEDALTVNKLTNYIGIKDMRDATKYNLGNGYTGIYFTTGNIYDYDTEADTGDDYVLNGGLPEWAVIGNYISFDAAWYEIVNLTYDETLGEVIVISSVFTGSPTAIQVKCQYNRQKFNVHEFIATLATYNNQTIKVQFDLTDTRSNFPDIQYISEDILVKTRHSDTVKIEYYNDTNTDVYYKSGIKNLLRLPILNISGDHEDPFENLKADNKADLLSGTVYEMDLFEFEPVTKGMYRKLLQALSHKYITIDSDNYVKNASIEKEGPLEESNLYLVKAKMLKTKAPYNANVIGIEPILSDSGETLEVPNLIITGNAEFMAYGQ